MSRIHDALRRGRQPAGEPAMGRTAHADAVLAALGYRSDKPRIAPAALTLSALVLLLAVLAAAWLVPLSELNPFRTQARAGRRRHRTTPRGSQASSDRRSRAPASGACASPDDTSASAIVPSVTPTVEDRRPILDPPIPTADPRSRSLDRPQVPPRRRRCRRRRRRAPIVVAAIPKANPAPSVEKPRTDPRLSTPDRSSRPWRRRSRPR